MRTTVILLLVLANLAYAATVPTITTAFGGSIGDGGPALNCRLDIPLRAVVDASGNIYFSDCYHRRVRRIAAGTGTITTVAGNGAPGADGIDGPALLANVEEPSGVALDAAGNLYICDRGIRDEARGNHRIYKVEASTGILRLVAGNGTMGSAGDGGQAISASFNFPTGVALDSSGNVYICDQNNHRVRKVTVATGIITTVAGTGTPGYSGDGGPATMAQLNRPAGMTMDAAGNLYIAEEGNHRIRKVTAATGIITSIAGTGTAGYTGDGGPATSAALRTPSDVKIDTAGNLYVADANNYRIRKITAAGTITTIAGNGTSGFLVPGGPATSTGINLCWGIALTPSGDLVFPSQTPCVWHLDTTLGELTALAGFGSPTASDAGSAVFLFPKDVIRDAVGNHYVADASAHRVFKIAKAGPVTTIAGTGERGYSGDGGPGNAAKLNRPGSLALDANGHLLIADEGNHRIRRVDLATQVITTAVGTGTSGWSGDGGPASAADIRSPQSLCSTGNSLWFIDNFYRIRRVDFATGIIAAVAGADTPGGAGDGGPALSATLAPRALTCTPAGDVFVADYSSGAERVRKITAGTQMIDAFLPVDTACLAWDDGTLLYADRQYRVWRYTPGTNTTALVAGDGTWGYGGDGGPAHLAQLKYVYGLRPTLNGNLLVADTHNGRIRQVDFSPSPPAGGSPETSPGSGGGGGCGMGSGISGLLVLLGIAGVFVGLNSRR